MNIQTRKGILNHVLDTLGLPANVKTFLTDEQSITSVGLLANVDYMILTGDDQQTTKAGHVTAITFFIDWFT